MMKIQSCYMQGYFDLLYYEIDSYRHFLASTAGIPKDFIDNDKKILKYFHRLTKITEKQDKKELEYFKDELIELDSNNIYLKWISSKIIEILNAPE